MARTPPDARRRQWLRATLLAAAPAALAGCGLARGPRQDFHLLRDGGDAPAAVPPAAGIDKVLLVAANANPGLYDGDRMVFSIDGRSRSYFQFGYWSERPAQSLQLLSEARLVRSQRFREVVSSTAGVRGDLLLSLRLDELYLDASADPGEVWLIVTVELIDWRSRKLLGRHSFRHAAAVSQRDAAGLAAAASRALGSVLDELVPWAAASAGSPT